MFGYYEESYDRPATEAEADREYAHWAGEANHDRPWILSDRDVWYANPFYTGPAVPHPEDDIYEKEDLFFFNAEKVMPKCADLVRKAEENKAAARAPSKVFYICDNGDIDECPF
jgi:hypothetical protein